MTRPRRPRKPSAVRGANPASKAGSKSTSAAVADSGTSAKTDPVYRAHHDEPTVVQALRREIRTLKGQITKLDQEREAIQSRQRVLTCVYCGHQYPPGTPPSNHAALTAHIKRCERHPMRAYIEALRHSQDALLGVIVVADGLDGPPRTQLEAVDACRAQVRENGKLLKRP